MARHGAVYVLAQLGIFHRAAVDRNRAAGVEVAAARRRSRRRDVALEHDALLPHCRVEGWDNKKDVLKISDNTACSTSTFGLGSTKNEVREVQGKPTKIVHREGTSGFLPIEREWMDKFISHGYKDTFRMVNQEPENYTYWDQITKARDRNVGWRIDYFFVDNAFADQVTDAYIHADVMGSDHCPVGIDMTIN